MTDQLAKLDRARQSLAEARTLDDILNIRDQAQAIKAYYKAHHVSVEIRNNAAEIAILAARKAGEILKKVEKSKGGAAANFADAETAYSKLLKESNIPDRTGRYWQKLAGIPQERVDKYFAEVSKAGGEISTAGLLKVQPHAEKRRNRKDSVEDFEQLRVLTIKMLNEGYKHLKAAGMDPGQLDAAKTWAMCRLETAATVSTDSRRELSDVKDAA